MKILTVICCRVFNKINLPSTRQRKPGSPDNTDRSPLRGTGKKKEESKRKNRITKNWLMDLNQMLPGFTFPGENG